MAKAPARNLARRARTPRTGQALESAPGTYGRLPRKRQQRATVYRYRRGAPPLFRLCLLMLLPVVAGWLLTRALDRHHHAQVLQRAPVRPIVVPVRPHRPPLSLAMSPLRVDGADSVSADRLDRILVAYGSPLRRHGRDLVALSRKYHIDDAVALAFFVMESRAGTEGEATLTHSFGNLRPMPNEPALDGYRTYRTWMEGAQEWFKVIRRLYLDQMHLSTVDAMIPTYAPASDNNDPQTMIAGIRQLVTCWRGHAAACPDTPAAVRTLVATGSGA